jgi:DNA-binding ferritin-like protein (Dps family)
MNDLDPFTRSAIKEATDMGISQLTAKMIGDKRRWRAYKARTRQLPENHRAAVDAMERYLMHFGPTDGDSAASVLEDLAELFEQAAEDGAPISEIVGSDPVEFVEAFVRKYPKGGYVTRERDRLVKAIDRADAGTRS